MRELLRQNNFQNNRNNPISHPKDQITPSKIGVKAKAIFFFNVWSLSLSPPILLGVSNPYNVRMRLFPRVYCRVTRRYHCTCPADVWNISHSLLAGSSRTHNTLAGSMDVNRKEILRITYYGSFTHNVNVTVLWTHFKLYIIPWYWRYM